MIFSNHTQEIKKEPDDIQEKYAALVLDATELNKEIDKLRDSLTERDESISELEIKLSQRRQEAIFASNDANNARSSLEVKAQLKASESEYARQCAVLQQDLSDSQSSNKVLFVKLEKTLDVAQQNLEGCRKVIAESNTLKHIVERGISELDKNFAQSGSLLESLRDNLRILLSRSKDISDKLSVSSDAVSENATSIESRLGQLQEAVSTLVSATSMKTFNDETRKELQIMNGHLKNHSNSIITVQQRINDVSRAQQSESLRQHMTGDDAQKQLGVIIELQRSSAVKVQADVLGVEHQLKEFMLVQTNKLADVVKSGLCETRNAVQAMDGHLENHTKNRLQMATVDSDCTSFTYRNERMNGTQM